MFSSKKRLQQRTRKKDLDRLDFLQALVTEFQEANEVDAKMQVLANLTNFAYDPMNYGYLRQLQVIELFLDCIADDEDISGQTVEFGIAGICNLAADPENRDLILNSEDSLNMITRCLSSPNIDTVLSAMTTLIQLLIPTSRDKIITPGLLECLSVFKNSNNSRIKNLAEIFLEDYCTEDERRKCQNHSTNFQTFLHIPLPANS